MSPTDWTKGDDSRGGFYIGGNVTIEAVVIVALVAVGHAPIVEGDGLILVAFLASENPRAGLDGCVSVIGLASVPELLANSLCARSKRH